MEAKKDDIKLTTESLTAEIKAIKNDSVSLKNSVRHTKKLLILVALLLALAFAKYLSLP